MNVYYMKPKYLDNYYLDMYHQWRDSPDWTLFSSSISLMILWYFIILWK